MMKINLCKMESNSRLDKGIFLSLARASSLDYFVSAHSYERQTGKDKTNDLIIYSHFLDGIYSVNKSKDGLELKMVCPHSDTLYTGSNVIPARFVFPREHSDLINDLSGDPKVQKRRIRVYPPLGTGSFRDFSDFSEDDISLGIDAEIVYRRGGFFGRDKLFLQGIGIDRMGKILQDKIE